MIKSCVSSTDNVDLIGLVGLAVNVLACDVFLKFSADTTTECEAMP
jgi:hypothetical protein